MPTTAGQLTEYQQDLLELISSDDPEALRRLRSYSGERREQLNQARQKVSSIRSRCSQLAQMPTDEELEQQRETALDEVATAEAKLLRAQAELRAAKDRAAIPKARRRDREVQTDIIIRDAQSSLVPQLVQLATRDERARVGLLLPHEQEAE